MTRDEALAVVRAAVVTVLEVAPEAVSEQTRLVDELQADSLAIVEVVEISEEELSRLLGRPVRLPDEVLDDLRTVADLLDQLLSAS